MNGKVKSVRVKGWLLEWWESCPNASFYVREALTQYLKNDNQDKVSAPEETAGKQFTFKKKKQEVKTEDLESNLNNFDLGGF